MIRAILLVLCLSSCVSHDARCRSWGAEPGTQAYISCMTELHAHATPLQEWTGLK